MKGENTRCGLTVFAVFSAFTFALVAPAGAANHSSKIYKWTDEHGVVHYGESVPPRYSHGKRQVIGPQGMLLDVLPAEKTSSQLAAERKRQSAARTRSEQQRRDRMLLNSYASIADIKKDRESHLRSLNARIGITHDTVKMLVDRLEQLVRKRRSEDHSPRTAHRIAHVKKQIKINSQALAREKSRRATIKKRFAADIARFEQLTKPTLSRQAKSDG
jgi:DNA-binding MarR family transcriptional regulator